MPTNWKQLKAIEQKNKERILAVCSEATDDSGIYWFARSENGFDYCYVGQAKHLLTRLAQHLSGYQHIDLSIKKHGLYGGQNLNGWMVSCVKYAENELDEAEQRYIRYFASRGYQMYNHTTGSQGEGKRALGEAKSPKGYRDGVKQGERNVIKKIAHLFDKHLKAVTINPTPNKMQQKALDKFYEIIGVKNETHRKLL